MRPVPPFGSSGTSQSQSSVRTAGACAAMRVLPLVMLYCPSIDARDDGSRAWIFRNQIESEFTNTVPDTPRKSRCGGWNGFTIADPLAMSKRCAVSPGYLMRAYGACKVTCSSTVMRW